VTVQKTFANASPPYNVELTFQGVLGDVIARVDTNQDGRFDDWIGFFDDFGGWDVHLMTLLQGAGRTDIDTPLKAVLWIQSRPKAEVDAVLKTAWNAVCKLIADIVNKTWKRSSSPAPIDTSGNYRDPEEVFAALMAQTKHSEDSQGKAVLSIP
jgi:hypothetical protein